MSLIPDTNEGKILFFGSKNARWAAAPTAIGTTAGAVTALATKVATAQAKLAAAVAAREAAKNATADANGAIRDMAGAGADIVRQIRAKAATDGAGVYILAQIPAPATPGPVGPPGTPTAFRVTLNPDGSLRLQWKCPNPAGAVGTIYQVARRVGPAGEFATVGASGARTFVDATVPAGAANVTYQVQAVRSTAAGVAGLFTVNFGVAGGAATASVAAEAVGMRAAA